VLVLDMLRVRGNTSAGLCHLCVSLCGWTPVSCTRTNSQNSTGSLYSITRCAATTPTTALRLGTKEGGGKVADQLVGLKKSVNALGIVGATAWTLGALRCGVMQQRLPMSVGRDGCRKALERAQTLSMENMSAVRERLANLIF
jgi:hypothetical protein